MHWEYELTYFASLKAPLVVGHGPFGQRVVAEVTGGRCEGERIRGTILTGGADWLLLGPDGWARLDVRAQVVTDDGAAIYLSYFGLLEMNDKVRRALEENVPTDYADQYFRTQPRFETGDPRYAWLNQACFAAEGRLLAGPGVEYRVYRIT